VEGQQSLFDTLWNKALLAEQRIREIDEGIKPDFIETISDPYHTRELAIDLIKSAKQEILILFSTINSFRRQDWAGLIQLLIDTASHNNVRIRILTHLNNETKTIVDRLKTNENVDVKYLHGSLQTWLTTLVIDRKLSLEVEVKDDNKDKSVGLATYSNRESTVWTHASIFETLWFRAEIEEKERTSLRV